MADSFLTLADLVKINDPANADIDVSDLLNRAAIINRIAATLASNGTSHKYTKETGAPTVGFRSVNSGTENSKSADTQVSIDLKILAASFATDKALADAHGKGPEALIGREAARHLRAAFFEGEKQLLYGTGNDSDGFLGLVDADTVKYKDSELVVDAGGTTPDTATSVWFICTNGDETEVTAVAGNEGVIEIGETIVQRMTDGDGNGYPAYYTPIEGWLGLQIGSKWSVGRIVNLTAQAGKGLTDTLLSQMLEKMPNEVAMIGMNRRSRGQLQRSRTTYSPTGMPAPLPTEYEGIPIVVAESIGNTEALVANES